MKYTNAFIRKLRAKTITVKMLKEFYSETAGVRDELSVMGLLGHRGVRDIDGACHRAVVRLFHRPDLVTWENRNEWADRLEVMSFVAGRYKHDFLTEMYNNVRGSIAHCLTRLRSEEDYTLEEGIRYARTIGLVQRMADYPPPEGVRELSCWTYANEQLASNEPIPHGGTEGKELRLYLTESLTQLERVYAHQRFHHAALSKLPVRD